MSQLLKHHNELLTVMTVMACMCLYSCPGVCMYNSLLCGVRGGGMFYLTVQEAKAHFGAVDQPAIVLYIDAALLPATGRVIGKRRVPFDVLDGLEVFR